MLLVIPVNTTRTHIRMIETIFLGHAFRFFYFFLFYEIYVRGNSFSCSVQVKKLVLFIGTTEFAFERSNLLRWFLSLINNNQYNFVSNRLNHRIVQFHIRSTGELHGIIIHQLQRSQIHQKEKDSFLCSCFLEGNKVILTISIVHNITSTSTGSSLLPLFHKFAKHATYYISYNIIMNL